MIERIERRRERERESSVDDMASGMQSEMMISDIIIAEYHLLLPGAIVKANCGPNFLYFIIICMF